MSRGGAGNILAVQQEKARINADVEANLQPTIASAPATQQIRTQEYAFKGRGGSGNYYSPKDLKETGEFSHDNPVAQARSQNQDQTDTSNQAPVAKHGRGGIGNMIFGASESEQADAAKKLDDEKVKREEIEVESEREAGQSIAMPPKAKLPLPGYDPNEPPQQA